MLVLVIGPFTLRREFQTLRDRLRHNLRAQEIGAKVFYFLIVATTAHHIRDKGRAGLHVNRSESFARSPETGMLG